MAHSGVRRLAASGRHGVVATVPVGYSVPLLESRDVAMVVGAVIRVLDRYGCRGSEPCLRLLWYVAWVFEAAGIAASCCNVVPERVCRSCVSRFLAFVHPTHCLAVFLYCTSGGVASFCLAKFLGLGGIVLTCSEE